MIEGPSALSSRRKRLGRSRHSGSREKEVAVMPISLTPGQLKLMKSRGLGEKEVKAREQAVAAN